MTSTEIRWDHLSEEERNVLQVIAPARGRDQAISVPEVAQLTGISGRECQRIVKALVETHHIPIGSSSSKPPGWYLCVSEGELLSNYTALRRRALSIFRRAKAFDPRHNARVRELLGQLDLLDRGR